MQLIHPQQVLYWHAERINGVMMLTEIRIWELLDEQAGWFSELPVMQVRVIKRDSFEVWRPQVVAENKPAVWVAEETGPNTLGHIPVVPFYAKRTGYFTSRPPLIDLAELNVEHWQSSSDQRNILHVARVPLLTVTSDDEDFSLQVGASRALRLPTNSKAEFVETKGAAITAGRQDLLDIEERMRQIGADLISLNVGKMAATQASILDSRSQSKLGAMAQSLEDALNLALYEWAQWIGADNGGTVEVFKDFGVDLTNAQDEAVLLNAANAGKLSNQTFYEELQRRGTLADTVSWEEEQARQEAQGPQLGAFGSVTDPTANAGNIGNPANTAANAGGLNGNGE